MRNIAAAFALATGVFVAWHSTSSADETCPCPVAARATPPQPAVTEIPPSGPPIILANKTGTLLRLPVIGRHIFVASPEVANVDVVDAKLNLLYVYARKPGITSLYATDDDGQVILNRVVEIPGRLRQFRL